MYLQSLPDENFTAATAPVGNDQGHVTPYPNRKTTNPFLYPILIAELIPTRFAITPRLHQRDGATPI
jgi:hypothetical protein